VLRNHPQNLIVLPGDGIGPEVIAAGLQVLETCARRDGGFALAVEQFDWGSDYYRKHGVMMPADGRDRIRHHDAIYFGARELQGREGRRVMVIVTDGGDTTSVKKYKDAVNAAQRAEAIFYPIIYWMLTALITFVYTLDTLGRRQTQLQTWHIQRRAT